MKKVTVKMIIEYEISDKDILNKNNKKVIKDLAERKATEMLLFDIIEKKEIPNISYETKIKDEFIEKLEKFLIEKYPHNFEILDKVEIDKDEVIAGFYLKMQVKNENYYSFTTERFKIKDICPEAEKSTI